MSKFDYKSLTIEELRSIFDNTLSFAIDPMWHQLVSLAFALTHDRAAFLHGVGTGKTLCSLWAAQLWGSKKALVACPSSAFSAWERDISKYTNLSFDFLTGSGGDRKDKLKKEKDIYICNYEGLKTIYANLKKGKGWKIDYSLFTHHFDCLILDEVHKCKSYRSLQSRICHELSKRAKNVVGLTGTAFDSDLLEPFNIFKVIDLGKALGNNYFLYRSKYFKPGFYGWNIKKGMEEKILAMMAKSTISFDREECFDLPEIQEIVREVAPSKEFLDLQHKIITMEDVKINGRVVYLGKILETETANGSSEKLSSQASLLRELTGGFFYYKEDEKDKDKLTCFLKKNTKMEALLDLLEDTTGKVIVFYLHVAEGLLIQKALSSWNRTKKNKIKFRMMQGGQKRLEKKKAEVDFTNDPDVKCMITQISTGSEGWDGSAANVAVFYSLVPSPLLRKQCIGRIHRKGQQNKCLVVDLQLKHSVDVNTLKNKGKRMDFVANAMEFMREYGGIDNLD